MLDLSRCKPELTIEMPISTFAQPLKRAWACSLSWKTVRTRLPLAPAQPILNLFCGVALSYFANTTQAPFVDILTVDPNAYTVTLSQIPTAATSILVKNVIANPDGYPPQIGGATVFQYDTGTTAPASGHFIVASNVLTFNANMAGQQVIVTYRYNLSAAQAQFLIGTGVVGNTMASDVTGTIGIIQKGIVYTTDFNTANDWGAADLGTAPGGTNSYISLGANGLFQVSISDGTPTGAPVNATVYEVPSADQPFLGLYLRG